jgi:hypothetical protein
MKKLLMITAFLAVCISVPSDAFTADKVFTGSCVAAGIATGLYLSRMNYFCRDQERINNNVSRLDSMLKAGGYLYDCGHPKDYKEYTISPRAGYSTTEDKKTLNALFGYSLRSDNNSPLVITRKKLDEARNKWAQERTMLYGTIGTLTTGFLGLAAGLSLTYLKSKIVG